MISLFSGVPVWFLWSIQSVLFHGGRHRVVPWVIVRVLLLPILLSGKGGLRIFRGLFSRIEGSRLLSRFRIHP